MKSTRSSKNTTHLRVVGTENTQIGSPKEELLIALEQFKGDCAGAEPANPDRLSLREIARISEDLTALYQPPTDPRCRLYALSVAAISEILAGKRQGLPAFEWIASFVLACQRYAVGHRPGRRDQGTTILRHWANIYAAHSEDPCASAGPAAVYQLPAHQQNFVLQHGRPGRVLLARAQRGHPHARYRVAVLLACDSELTEQAVGLLIDVASTGHAPSLDLLDSGVCPQTAAQRAWDLARTAWAAGDDDQAYAFCRAAARGGIGEAVLRLGRELLIEIDPEAAEWLGQLGTEATVGRHTSSKTIQGRLSRGVVRLIA